MPDGVAYSLLDEALLPVRLPSGGPARLTLPQVLATLSAGEIESFADLAAHQRQAWFQFLAQVAAIALNRAGATALPAEADAWSGLLRALAPDDPEAAWSLVVADPARPAFLQPPVRQGGLERLAPLADTPDGLDILVTAKDHDVKMARLNAAAPHHWLYALLNLQTMQGYLGRGNFGIARMNGGFASRVLVELAPSQAWGGRFRRAVAVLLESRDALLDDRADYFDPDGGLALLWLEPWDDDRSLSLAALDPYFIEVCRRVRLVQGAGGAIAAIGRPSAAARVEAKAAKGHLGDPWMPVDEAAGSAVTIGENGFDYRRVCEILSATLIRLPAAVRPRPDDPEEALLHFQVLVRGQGKTDGLHERWVHGRPGVRRALFDPEERAHLHALANEMIADVREGARTAVKAGLCSLLQGGPEAIDFRDRRADPLLRDLDARVDEVFFDWLWRLYEARDAAGRDSVWAEWQRVLADAARAVFRRGLLRLQPPEGRRERAQALAERAFAAVLHKRLPTLAHRDAPAAAPREETVP